MRVVAQLEEFTEIFIWKISLCDSTQGAFPARRDFGTLLITTKYTNVANNFAHTPSHQG